MAVRPAGGGGQKYLTGPEVALGGPRKRTRKIKIDVWEEQKRKIIVRRWGQNNIQKRDRDAGVSRKLDKKTRWWP